MIRISNLTECGVEEAIRGMRNPMNSWDKSDSEWLDENIFNIGEADRTLMTKLNANGPSHSKYRRMMVIYMDIAAPLYWWKEFDTYKVGTVANSCSTMHKIMSKPFEISDFSYDHLTTKSLSLLYDLISELTLYRDIYIHWDTIDENTKNAYHFHEKKDVWWQIIQLLPSSYMQKRTVMINYEVFANIVATRSNHKLDEWHDFIKYVAAYITYPELISDAYYC